MKTIDRESINVHAICVSGSMYIRIYISERTAIVGSSISKVAELEGRKLEINEH